MQAWETLSGRNTYFGKPGSTARLVISDMEYEERIRQKVQRRRAKTYNENAPKAKISDEELNDLLEFNIKLTQELNEAFPVGDGFIEN